MDATRSFPLSPRRTLFIFLLLLLAAIYSRSTAYSHADNRGGDNDAATLLQRTLDRAHDAGSYQIDTSLEQSLIPEQSLFSGAHPETVHLEMVGSIKGPAEARFSIELGRSSLKLGRRDPQELLIKDGAAYLRNGDRWNRTESAPALAGGNLDGLLLASAAADVVDLDKPAGPPGLESLSRPAHRLGFRIDPEQVAEALMKRQAVDASVAGLARLQMPRIEGDGELWIGEDDLPSRLILNLRWRKHGSQPAVVLVQSESIYHDFGISLPDDRFDPLRSATDGTPLPKSPMERALDLALWPALLVMVFLLFVTLRRARRRKYASRVVSMVLLISLIAPGLTPVVEASGMAAELRGDVPEPQSDETAFETLLNDINEIADRRAFSDESPLTGLDAFADEDKDTLPNGYELRLGTSPFAPDSDYDGLTDAEEVNGVPCEWQNQIRHIISDPLNPDSNHDGLRDGDEYWRGKCHNGNAVGHVWVDDNDRDGVPDGLDLSPFSSSQTQGSNGAVLGGKWSGANFDFESLDMDPTPTRTRLYPFYVEVQVRPQNEDALRWAYKHLFWPGDHEGAIQNTDPIARLIHQILTGNEIGTSGKLTLLPFLSARVLESDLPSPLALSEYGVSARTATDAEGNPLSENGEPLFELVMPLVPVERGGQIFAFQTKMLHNQNQSDDLLRRWQDVRLKWAVTGDLLLNDANGDMVPSPDGGYGLVVYDEPFYVTGLQVTRQGGATALIAAHLPNPLNRNGYNDGPISALRAGMEHKFLRGELDMAVIKDRFDDPSSASIDQRWGIPDGARFRVDYEPGHQYPHLDAAITSVTMTRTKTLLNQEFGTYQELQPTLLQATEQRTSSVNLDDDWSTDYRAISINTCLKPLVTSRSLKLSTYRWGFDGLAPVWEPLSLDEVLDKVENEYAATNANAEFYAEELSILKLTVTAWHVGQTAIQAVGAQSWQDLNSILSDAKLAVHFLTENGLFPSEFKDVVFEVLKIWEQGGPVEWLKKQWNTVVEYYDETVEFFEGSYTDYAPPASRVTVLGSEQGSGNNGPPAEAEPFDKDILSYTESALSVLSLLASLFGGVLQEIVNVLTRIVQIYKALRQLIDIVTTVVQIAVVVATYDVLQTVELVAGLLAKELGSLAKPLSVVGLIFAVGFTWIMAALQLNDVGPSIALTIIVRAIVETVILVVLFVIAAAFPFGTLVAIGIGFIMLLESLFGFAFDPISLLLDWLFGIEQYERARIIGDPKFGQPSFEAQEPGGGSLSGRVFQIKLGGIVKMGTTNEGSKSDLETAWAQLHVGRFADGREYGLCTPSEDTFKEYKESLQGFWFGEHLALAVDCVNFRLPNEKYWLFTPSGALNATDAQLNLNPLRWERDILSSAWVNIKPVAGINSRLFVDVSMDVQIPVDQCSTFGGCDRYYFSGTGAPSIIDEYLDILPSTLTSMWSWEDLHNPDPDGDGLVGFISTATGNPIGPDANLCANMTSEKTINDWDSDDDGLSDRFELESDELNPCLKDSDADGLEDGLELLIGTQGDRKDTDRDGLSDYDETARHNSVGHLIPPWTVDLQSSYPNLPDPVAFPSPINANRESDHRRDDQEKKKRSSPNAFDPVPIGELVSLSIGQNLQQGGGTQIIVNSAPWQNDETTGLAATLTLTLPQSMSNVSTALTIAPPLPYPQLNTGIVENTGQHNVYRWSLPPFFFQRYARATVTGIPAVSGQPISITASLEYNEAGQIRQSTSESLLLVNAGGPLVNIAGVSGGVITGGSHTIIDSPSTQANGPLIIQGSASDPQRVGSVYFCLVPAGPCDTSDWKVAAGKNTWSYSFGAPADGHYIVRAYAVDTFGLPGPSVEVPIGIDRSAPIAVDLDQSGLIYATTHNPGAEGEPPGPPIVSFAGEAHDATGAAYVSGMDKIGVSIDGGARRALVSVEDPGAPSSRFSFDWTPPYHGFGRSLPSAQGPHRLVFGAQDVAGNPGNLIATLDVIVDDTPPGLRGRPPQVIRNGEVQLSGLVDDTAFVYTRSGREPFSTTLTSAHHDGELSLGSGHATIVSDITGDLIDELLLLIPAQSGPTPAPIQAALFFGQPGGFEPSLTMNQADVILQGELPVDGFDFDPVGEGVGDVNGDGVGDLLIGDANAGSGEGIAYLIPGRRTSWPPTLDLAGEGWRLEQPGSFGFGGSVGAAGDVNGDGLSDFLVAAGSLGIDDGPVWLYLGQEIGPADAHRMFIQPRAAAPLPPNLAGLGDTDGDGLSDFLIAPADASPALVLGRGDDEWPDDPVSLSNSADLLLDTPGSMQTVSPAGDINEDGLNDGLIGDPDSAQPTVYLLLGKRGEERAAPAPTIHPVKDVTDGSYVQPVGVPPTRLGASLTPLGDQDRDGRDDFAFGQPGAGRGPNRAVLVLSANSHIAHDLPVPGSTLLISGTVDTQRFGEALAAGDVNGDSTPDLYIGAAGEQRGYIFHSNFDPGLVTGVERVEIGLSEPILDHQIPLTKTVPKAWRSAELGSEWQGIRTWRGEVDANPQGEFRIYARAFDRAGNRSNEVYLGLVHRVDNPLAFAGATVTIAPPTLVDGSELTLDGQIQGGTPQTVRAWNGYEWKRLPAKTGGWSWTSIIPPHDLYVENFRVVARDAYGHRIQDRERLAVDTQIEPPILSADQVVNRWWTDNDLSLKLTWVEAPDASGIQGRWASVDTLPEGTAQTPAGAMNFDVTLKKPGVYWGHLRIQDGAKNETEVHSGPFLLNRSLTPSVIYVDGIMERNGGEYPSGTLLNYDPYAAIGPAAFWGTWNEEQLFLGYPGNPWGDDNRLVLYLDTKAGGLDQSLDLQGSVHTLPFDADYALVVGGAYDEPFTLYRAQTSWTQIVDPKSIVAQGFDTEIALHRDEIEARGSVSLLAYGEYENGVWMTLPANARPAIDSPLQESLSFTAALSWNMLADGVKPGAGQKQVTAPEISLIPGQSNALPAGQTATFQMTVRNPHVGDYVAEPISLSVAAPMQLLSLSGATCTDCPPGSSEWRLAVDVAAGDTATVTVQAKMEGQTLDGVFPVPVRARMLSSGLAASPQSPAQTDYVLDQSRVSVRPLAGEIHYVQPGQHQFGLLMDISLASLHRCVSKVEVNSGGGWNQVCGVGDCFSMVESVGVSQVKEVQVRVNNGGGRTSDPYTLSLIADDTTPSITISNTDVLTGAAGALTGFVWDTFPGDQPPRRVEVSLNGAPFRPALVSAQSRVISSGAKGASWHLPLRIYAADGREIKATVRTIDEAGNISASIGPMTIILDSEAPEVQVVQFDGLLTGKVSDGSGVGALSVSLDGGLTFTPIPVQDGSFSFALNRRSRSGDDVALLRAEDIHGNVAVTALPIPAGRGQKLFLPFTARRADPGVGLLESAGMRWQLHFPLITERK